MKKTICRRKLCGHTIPKERMRLTSVERGRPRSRAAADVFRPARWRASSIMALSSSFSRAGESGTAAAGAFSCGFALFFSMSASARCHPTARLGANGRSCRRLPATGRTAVGPSPTHLPRGRQSRTSTGKIQLAARQGRQFQTNFKGVEQILAKQASGGALRQIPWVAATMRASDFISRSSYRAKGAVFRKRKSAAC